MNTILMVDQSERHDCNPNSNSAKLLRAREYLTSRNIEAVARGSEFKYVPAMKGSRVLRHLLKRAA